MKPDSTTETYVAMKLRIENWRWAGVPFYLRAGKRLPKRVTEIAIVFRPAPHSHLPQHGARGQGAERARAANPAQRRDLSVLRREDAGPRDPHRSRRDGLPLLRSVRLRTRPRRYERLLHDALLGESTLFARRDEVEGAWAIIDAVVAGWRQGPAPDLPNYAAGTWNPEEAVELLTRDRRWWRRL